MFKKIAIYLEQAIPHKSKFNSNLKKIESNQRKYGLPRNFFFTLKSDSISVCVHFHKIGFPTRHRTLIHIHSVCRKYYLF